MSRRLVIVISLALCAVACSDAESDSVAATTALDFAQPSTTAPPVTSTTTTAPSSTTTQPPSTTTTTPPTTASNPQPDPAACGSLETGAHMVAIGQGQVMDVLVPSSFDGTPLPVVMNFHGLGSDGVQEAGLTAYPILAELEGFIVAHPTGKPGPGDNRNSWELAQFDIPDRDDIGLVNTIIDQLIQEFCGDPARVYSTGMSNGGLFTSYLVCEISERLAAVVSVAGVTHHDECQPDRAVPMMAFHGTADQIVPFAGGVSSLPGGDSDFFKQVMPDEFAQFAADFSCDASPTKTEVSSEVIRYDYTDCDEGVPMVFFEITGGGHTWPGSLLGLLMTDILGKTTYDVDATTGGWEFMSQFSLDG
jgi:polyhydroxybutyrate depolymerase